ncbi:MAG: serine/threonine protein kinase [Deltaproteobacteria bacterium]|nr:MAG: serine/threonine protein kinase [Deltaproteobacteria bacterium]
MAAMSTQENQRYEVLDRLDAGGMAEVFRGKALSLGGLEKAVAIKRVLPSLVGNDKFVKMFIDEARLSLRLSHANIVTVFDIARSGPTYFIVMEFVDGTNLKRIVELGQPLPVGLAVLIAIEVCKGLAYAHDRTDNEGRPLGVVHRDVSPPNILISRKGEVKLTDFGLAKAKSQIETTDPGVVKGKFSYLAPEAAHGEEVDRRADIFATGIVLWEMLSGRRLFLGDTDQDTLRLVRAAELPPLRSLNADVPPELEEIVRKSLARDKERRYQTARDFAKALSGFVVSSGQAASSFDLEGFIEDFLKRQRSQSPSNAVRDELTRAVIQEEMNKLIHIGDESQSDASAVRRTSNLVDTRTWDFGEDEDEEDDGPLSTAPMAKMAASVPESPFAAGAGLPGAPSGAPPSLPRPGPVRRAPAPSSAPSLPVSAPSVPAPPSAAPPRPVAASASAPPAPPGPSAGGESSLELAPTTGDHEAAAPRREGSQGRPRSGYAQRGEGRSDILDAAPVDVRIGHARPVQKKELAEAGPSGAETDAEPAAAAGGGQALFAALILAIVAVAAYLVWMLFF